MTNGVCPPPVPGPTHLPALLLEARPLQRAAVWDSSSLPALAGHSWRGTCPEPHPDVEMTTQHPSCHALSALPWNGVKILPVVLLIKEGNFFLNFTLLPVCKTESGTHSRESTRRGNNCVGLLLQVQANPLF